LTNFWQKIKSNKYPFIKVLWGLPINSFFNIENIGLISIKIILSKSIQSVTAGWLIRIVGLSLIEYFKNGQDWGDGGIQEVVDKIYKISKREDILNNFVKEAISKIEMKKYIQSNKSLPPLTN